MCGWEMEPGLSVESVEGCGVHVYFCGGPQMGSSLVTMCS